MGLLLDSPDGTRGLSATSGALVCLALGCPETTETDAW
jgi:hypothetical protein